MYEAIPEGKLQGKKKKTSHSSTACNLLIPGSFVKKTKEQNKKTTKPTTHKTNNDQPKSPQSTI